MRLLRSTALNWSISVLDSGDSSIRIRIVSSREVMIPVRYSCSQSLLANIVTIGHHSKQSYISHESLNPGCFDLVAWIRHRFLISRYPHLSQDFLMSFPLVLSNISYTRQHKPSHLSHIVSRKDIKNRVKSSEH